MTYQVVAVVPQDKKVMIYLDNGDSFVLYKGEAAKLSLFENEMIDDVKYQQIMKEILGKRATKRAMHLLEQQDRTEKQLRDKLVQGGYPDACIEQAIAYVKSYHYVDDYRYATVYIRYHQAKESRQKLTQKLMMRGISRDIIMQALEEEFVTDECAQIKELLRKRGFDPENADEATRRKTVQFLMRKGFRSSDIFRVMRMEEEF
ncbi:MAG: regulatory protein RecX [Lachnospiraceae bacterium]|nr:regulatory protein RecX [Lachnospiraceae bacterium]